MMTQAELVREISDSTGIARTDVKMVLEVLEEIGLDEIKAGEKFKIVGLVQLQAKIRPARKARMGRNPQTGESVKVPAKPASATVKARVLSKAKKAAPSVQKLKKVSAK